MESVGEPLFLTKYLENNSAGEAKRAAAVEPKICGITSYSGFLTVDKELNSNLFFWYFPAAQRPDTAPVFVWTNGWHSSCLSNLFNGHGPYALDNSGIVVTERDTSWHRFCHIVYLDSTVNDGFSFTDDDDGYRTDQADIGKDLYSAVAQFFGIFPELKDHELYVGGISYSGKYSTALAHTIHEQNLASDVKLNLKGIIYVNPFMDPIIQTRYGDYLLNLGLIDNKAKAHFDEVELQVVELVENENYREAGYVAGKLLLFGEKSFFNEVTGLGRPHHALFDSRPSENWKYFVQLPHVKKSIHVGGRTIGDGNRGVQKLLPDLMKSVKPWIEVLIEHYRLLFVSGQLDIVCGYPMLAKSLESLDWSGMDGFRNSERQILRSETRVDGYIRTHGNLTECMVIGAGHLAVTDQPKSVTRVVEKFISNLLND